MVDASTMLKDCRFVEIYDSEIILRSDKTSQVVSIDRRTSLVTKKTGGATGSGSTLNTFAIQAVYGIIELVGSKYLIVVSNANFIGEIFSRKIFQAQKLKYIPIDKRVAVTNAKNMPLMEEDRTYIEMLDNFFSKKFLYFSHDYDLTCTIQRACDTHFEKGFHKSQYFWNESHVADFIKNDLSDWVVPFISGLVEIRHIVLPQAEFDFILISRRDKRRSGMRFISRGCDLDGNCSNTADTEQILALYKKNSLDTKVFAHVQVRGSIPFLWKQKPNLKWEPLGDIYLQDQNVEVAKKHFEKIVKDYGNQVCINLIDKKRTQLKMGTEFQRVTEELIKAGDKNIRYVWFDFHQECKKMKYENLSRLLTLIETDSSHMGMFEADIIKGQNGSLTGTVIQSQKGTFRTNCMDCLDRTNVVQSVIGRKQLHLALIHAKLSDKNVFSLKPFETLPGNLEEIFREVWTNNANTISMLYTGTGALKTDFTRTGKRTKQGAFQDAKNSIVRYVKGNFYDHYNQNSIDLVLGKWRPKEKPYRGQKISNFWVLGFIIMATPIITKVILDTMHAEIFEPNQHKIGGQIKGLVFYLTVFGLTFAMLFKAIAGNPHKFVELPVLNQ